jgi:hypothetical protein
MRVRITAKTSLFYGEEGEVIRSTHGHFGEPQLTVRFDISKETGRPFVGGPFALPFFTWEIEKAEWLGDDE